VGLPLPPTIETLLFDVEVGIRPWTEIPGAINAAVGLDLAADEWRELWLGIFVGEVPGMRAILAELKARHTLVALSNTSQVHWEHVTARYPIFGLLDGWVVSYAERAAKPDPAMYQAVMDRWCAHAPPVFYTDDIPRYVEGARALGWDAEVFTTADEFRGALARRNLT
jgi:2-haloacid dehalogenase